MNHNEQWVADIFDGQLVDLGTSSDDRLHNIYSPIYDRKEVERFMSKYYESDEGAKSQADKIDLTGYYHGLLNEAFDSIGFDKSSGSNLTVLELGCGFGSATFPLIDLLPNSKLVASEFSIAMLAELKNKLNQQNMLDKCVLMQLNAEDMQFKPQSFDVIVGAAILHHLFEPEKVLEGCAKLLKPNGIAIFFEPFEHGLGMVRDIYNLLLGDYRKYLLGPRKYLYLKRCVYIWLKMMNQDKTDTFFNGLDDKWLFRRDYFEQMCVKYNFSECTMYSLSKSDTPLEELITTHFDGNNIHNMPDWVWNKIRKYEAQITGSDKLKVLTEGCIILKK
jgi:ubiquinone/menaquinone biosynthesis C-methylase UbiE